MKLGAYDFIEKPFSNETIVASIRRAVDLATSQVDAQQVRERVQDRLDSLSGRERQVLKGVVDGQPNKLIAIELGISPRTVEVYRSALMGKMQAQSLAELVRMVMDIDLSGPDGEEGAA